MRILMTTDTIGGVWTFTSQLAEEWLGMGHSIALVSLGREPSSSQRETCRRLARIAPENFRYDASNVPLEWMQENASAYQSGEAALLECAHSFAPDLLLSSQFCFGALPLDIPRVVVAHSDVLSWADAARDTPLPRSPWLDRYVTMVARGLDAASTVVAPTRWMLGALARNFQLPSKGTVIANGRTLPASKPSSKRRLQAVTAGRLWDEAKNVQMLRDVRSPMPLLVAGETQVDGAQGPEAFDGAELLGSLSESRLHILFAESAVYLCTSLYEPFGLAPLEAALCGCAVLANDLPSMREVWGPNALYFRDAATLTSSLQRLNHDTQAMAAAQQRSQQRARTYTARRMAEGYIALFETLCHGQRSAVDAA